MTAFRFVDASDEEVDALEARYGPLAEAVRDLLDATIRTEVDDTETAEALRLVREATTCLRRRQVEGSAGIGYNASGRSWSWGNAAVGLRNAVAPPMAVVHDEDGSTRAEVDLGAAYEGPPGLVHGGVSALLLDHLMGVTASHGMSRVTVTGTLTLRYREQLPLGRAVLTGRISGEDGRKVYVEARIDGANGVAVEAEGVFIVPRWSAFDDVVGAESAPPI
jgi:acyl-coenzyme A thioesterase PaaI-like protein